MTSYLNALRLASATPIVVSNDDSYIDETQFEIPIPFTVSLYTTNGTAITVTTNAVSNQ